MEHGHAIAGSGALAWLLDAAGLHAALFLGGLAGGLTHCSVMCGPFVLAQVAARLERESAMSGGELARLAGGALIPYHLGRLTTYAALGAAAGALAGQITMLTGFGWLIAAFLALAAVLFLAQAFAALRRSGAGGGAIGRAIGRVVTPLMRDPRGWRGYALGVALGFLPCGLLYGALAAAAGAGGALGGAAAMVAFTLGTAPALIAVGWIGVFFGRRWAPAMRLAGPPVMIFNAVLLLALAWRALG